ncbi:unnamed protein product [Discosporangium mesarthrocarpum]
MDTHRMVWNALSMITQYAGAPVAVQVEATSGCVRSLWSAAMQVFARVYPRLGLDKQEIQSLLLERGEELTAMGR